MENDNIETPAVELVSSEISGYLGADGKFVYGEPPQSSGEIHTQDAEDAING